MAIYKGYSSVGRNFSGTEVVDTALVRADLLNHFNTRQGERVMQPTFGCLVWQYLFEPGGAALICLCTRLAQGLSPESSGDSGVREFVRSQVPTVMETSASCG